MFPQGFFGTRADLLLDTVISSLVLVVPLLVYSRRAAKSGRYTLHRNIQVWLTLVLTVVLVVFEWNLKSRGGIFEWTRESRYADSAVLKFTVYTHLLFAFSTAGIWLLLLVQSLIRFPNPPRPNAFSRSHRLWGNVAMVDTLLTGLSAVALYVVGFVL